MHAASTIQKSRHESASQGREEGVAVSGTVGTKGAGAHGQVQASPTPPPLGAASPSSAIVQPQHWSVFYPCGIEVQPPPALHYLHIGSWSTTPPCHDYYQHRHSRKVYSVGGPSASAAASIDPPGQKVLWLHTAQPRDRFVFLVAPVESARPKSLLVAFWSLIYGTPPAFAFTGGSLAWTRSGKLKASLQAKKGAKNQSQEDAAAGRKGKSYGWNAVVGRMFPSWRKTDSSKSPTSQEGSRNCSFSSQSLGRGRSGQAPSGSRASSTARGESDDESRGWTAPVSVEGVEAVEVLHDDITAIDYNSSLTTQRLALECQVVTTLWFPSKTAALEHYGVSPSTVIFLPSLPPAGLEVQQELAAHQADDRRGKLGVDVGPPTSNRLHPLPLPHGPLNRTLSRSGFPLSADTAKGASAGVPESNRPGVPLTPVATSRQLAAGQGRHPAITHGTTLLMMTRKPSQISPILTGKSAPTSHVVSPDQQPLQRGATIGEGGGFSFDCTIRGQIDLAPSASHGTGETPTEGLKPKGTAPVTPPLQTAALERGRNTNSPIPPLQLPEAVNATRRGHMDSSSTMADETAATSMGTKSAGTLDSFSTGGGRTSSASPCRTSASVGFMDDDPAPAGVNGETDADGAPPEAVLKKRVRPGSFAAKRLKKRAGQTQNQPVRGTPKSDVPTTPLDSTPTSVHQTTFRTSDRLSSKDNLLGRHEDGWADEEEGPSSSRQESMLAEEGLGRQFTRTATIDVNGSEETASPTKTPSRSTPLQGATSGVEWQYHQWGTVIIAADDEDSDDESDGQTGGMGLRAGSESSRQSETGVTPLADRSEKMPQDSPHREIVSKVGDGYWDSFGSEPQQSAAQHLGSSGNLSGSQGHKEKMKPIVEVHKRRIINTIVTVYSQDPHFNAVLREVLLPEKGNVAFTKDAQSQRRLLALYEAGMPSWTVFVARKGLMPYRRWIRLVVVFIYNLWPVIALGVGLYDLYKHMPYFKDWLSETFHPFTEWIDQHFTIVVSMWVGYFVSAGFNVLLGFYGIMKVFLSMFTVMLQPFASLLAILAMLKYPVVALWSFVSIAGSGLYSIFNAFGLILNTLLMPLRLIGTLFSIMFQYAPGGAAALQATAQSTNTVVQTWRNWLYFWDKVLRPVKNVLKALYDGVVHLGVAIAKREMSLRRWYLGLLSSAYAMLDRQASATVDVLRENIKILRVARPPSSVLLLLALALLWCTVGELLLDLLRGLVTYIAGVGTSDSGSEEFMANGIEELALATGIQAMA